eukprot:1816754-Prymnesium_polylepis.2
MLPCAIDEAAAIAPLLRAARLRLVQAVCTSDSTRASACDEWTRHARAPLLGVWCPQRQHGPDAQAVPTTPRVAAARVAHSK